MERDHNLGHYSPLFSELIYHRDIIILSVITVRYSSYKSLHLYLFTHEWAYLGGLGVTCSPRDPRFAGSNPTEVDGFFFQDVKILSTSPPGGTLRWGSRVWDFRLVKEPQAWKNRPLSKIKSAYSLPNTQIRGSTIDLKRSQWIGQQWPLHQNKYKIQKCNRKIYWVLHWFSSHGRETVSHNTELPMPSQHETSVSVSSLQCYLSAEKVSSRFSLSLPHTHTHT